MVKRRLNKNILPLLAVTALMLSVGLINFTQVSDSKVTNTQSVLSESDEEDEKNEIPEPEEAPEPEETPEPGEFEEEDESEFEQENESGNGAVSKFKLKIKTKTVNGKTLIETTTGEVEVENSPDDTVNNLIEDGILDTPVAFEMKTEDNKIEFEFRGIESKKLLGLFEVDLPKTVTVDAKNGEILSTNRSIWVRFLNLISI